MGLIWDQLCTCNNSNCCRYSDAAKSVGPCQHILRFSSAEFLRHLLFPKSCHQHARSHAARACCCVIDGRPYMGRNLQARLTLIWFGMPLPMPSPMPSPMTSEASPGVHKLAWPVTTGSPEGTQLPDVPLRCSCIFNPAIDRASLQQCQSVPAVCLFAEKPASARHMHLQSFISSTPQFSISTVFTRKPATLSPSSLLHSLIFQSFNTLCIPSDTMQNMPTYMGHTKGRERWQVTPGLRAHTSTALY